MTTINITIQGERKTLTIEEARELLAELQDVLVSPQSLKYERVLTFEPAFVPYYQSVSIPWWQELQA